MRARGFWIFPVFVVVVLTGVMVGDIVEYFRETREIETQVQLNNYGSPRHFSASWNNFDFGEGWSIAEKHGRWAIGSTARLSVHSPDSSARALVFDCRTYHDPETRQMQTITVYVNGQTIGRVKVKRNPMLYRIEIPEDMLQTGSNDIEMGFSFHHDPQASGETGPRRPLSVFFRSMELVDPEL